MSSTLYLEIVIILANEYAIELLPIPPFKLKILTKLAGNCFIIRLSPCQINRVFYLKLKTISIVYMIMDVIETFVRRIEKTNDLEEIKMLRNLWSSKIATFPKELRIVEEVEGDALRLVVVKGAEAILLHKATNIYLYITDLTSVELETLRYITIRKKAKEADNEFVSLAYEYITLKNKAKIGILS